MENATGGQYKVSHHSGQWRVAETAESAAMRNSERAVFDSWEPPPIDRGWRECVAVAVPVAYLRPGEADPGPSVQRIYTVPTHSAIRIRFFYEYDGAAARVFGRAWPIGILATAAGGRIYVLGEPTTVPPQLFEEFASAARLAREERDHDVDYPTDRFILVARAGVHQRVLTDLTIA